MSTAERAVETMSARVTRIAEVRSVAVAYRWHIYLAWVVLAIACNYLLGKDMAWDDPRCCERAQAQQCTVRSVSVPDARHVAVGLARQNSPRPHGLIDLGSESAWAKAPLRLDCGRRKGVYFAHVLPASRCYVKEFAAPYEAKRYFEWTV